MLRILEDLEILYMKSEQKYNQYWLRSERFLRRFFCRFGRLSVRFGIN
nr:MAG TPA: hypothetical protein [Caudoviricetes sp.]